MTATITSIEGGRGGQQPPGDGVAERVAKIEAVLPSLATKGDIAEAKVAIVTWVAVIGIGVATIVVSVMSLMFNRLGQTQPAQQPTPIIIYPQQQPASPSPPALQSPPASKPVP